MRINSEAIMEGRVIKARVFNGRLGTDRPYSREPARVRLRRSRWIWRLSSKVSFRGRKS